MRKCNLYFDSLIVEEEDRKTAEAFSREISWDIWRVLREAGARGMTAGEIAEALKTVSVEHESAGYKYPRSTIYQALDTLENIGFIESTTRGRLPWGRPITGERKRIGRDRGGRPLKVYTANLQDATALLSQDFAEELQPVIEKHAQEIKVKWMTLLESIIVEFKSDKDLSDFLPKDGIHERCGFSHEGYEFLEAVSLGFLAFIEEQPEWKEFARKNNIIKEK